MDIFAPGYEGELLDLTVMLSQLLFPILVLLGMTGMVVGVLNSYDRFGAFAISPLFWNIAIIAVLVGLAPVFPEGDEIYAYAIGVLVGTVVQLAIPAFDLRNTPFRLRPVFDWRSKAVRRVLLLMLPVTISLGLINFNFQINSFFGTLIEDPTVAERAPAAIDKAFRIYMLPQGIFSVAVATVDLPDPRPVRRPRRVSTNLRSDDGERDAPDRLPARPGRRGDPRPLRADDPPRLRARRVRRLADRAGRHRALLVRLLASLQRPLPAPHADLLQPPAPLAADRDLAAQPARHRDRLVRALQRVRGRRDRRRHGDGHGRQRRRAGALLRVQLGGLELPRVRGLAGCASSIASAALAGVAYLVWLGLDEALGRGLGGQIVSMGAWRSAAGAAVYAAAVYAMRVPEAGQIMRLLPGRSRRDGGDR